MFLISQHAKCFTFCTVQSSPNAQASIKLLTFLYESQFILFIGGCDFLSINTCYTVKSFIGTLWHTLLYSTPPGRTPTPKGQRCQMSTTLLSQSTVLPVTRSTATFTRKGAEWFTVLYVFVSSIACNGRACSSAHRILLLMALAASTRTAVSDD